MDFQYFQGRLVAYWFLLCTSNFLDWMSPQEHRQSAEVYAAERAQPPKSGDLWFQSLVQAEVKDSRESCISLHQAAS